MREQRESLQASAEQRSLAMLVALHLHREGIRRAALIAEVRRLIGDPECYFAPRAAGEPSAPRPLEERTIHRDLARVREWLDAHPWPDITVLDTLDGRERSYRLSRPLLSGIALTDGDREAVREIYQQLCQPNSGVRETVLPLLGKLAADDLNIAIGDVLPPATLGALTPAQRAAVQIIARARQQQRAIEFAYRGVDRAQAQAYKAWPIEISSFGTRVYVAMRKDDHQFRVFRLDRFVPRPDVPKQHQLVRPTGHAAPFPLRMPDRSFALRVTGALAAYFRDTTVFPDQATEPAPDGALIVRGTYRSDILLANAILRYGAAVELLEPRRLRKTIAEEIATLAALYARD
jgi:predicted DNA-binding transcriptional regulator YafY